MSPRIESHEIGRLGEDETLRRYAALGFTLIERNRRQARNEIDLVLQNDTHLVFVEVKTRHAIPRAPSRYGRPAAAIDKGKRARMRKAAEDYLRENPTTLQPRIDVAEVYVVTLPDGSDAVAEVKLYPNAYRGQ